VPPGPAERTDPTVALKGAERGREIVDMRIQGATFEVIGKSLGITRARAHKIYQVYLRKIPSGAIEEHRAIELERIADLRTRLWAEMNGRPDPKNPSIIRKPSPQSMANLIESAIKLSRHEAMILWMDVQPRHALAAAVHNGLTIDDIRELVENYHKNTATLKKPIDVTPQDLTNTGLTD
jgi:hypothetical protein